MPTLVFIKKKINEEYYLTETPLFILVDESQYDKDGIPLEN